MIVDENKDKALVIESKEVGADKHTAAKNGDKLVKNMSDKKLSIITLIFSVIGIFPVGLACGFVALDRAKKTGRKNRLAKVGVIISVIWLLVTAFLVFRLLNLNNSYQRVIHDSSVMYENDTDFLKDKLQICNNELSDSSNTTATIPSSVSNSGTSIVSTAYSPVLTNTDVKSGASEIKATQISITDWGIKGAFAGDAPIYSFQADSRGFEVMNFKILANGRDFYVTWIYRFKEDQPFYDFSSSQETSTLVTKDFINNTSEHWIMSNWADFYASTHNGIIAKRIGDYYYLYYIISDFYTGYTNDTSLEDRARYDKLNAEAHDTAEKAWRFFTSLEEI